MLIVTSTLATTSFCPITPVLFPLLFIRTISKLTFILPGLWVFSPQLSAFSHHNGHEFKSQSPVIGGLTLPLKALMILHVLHFYFIETTYPSWSPDCVLFFFEARFPIAQAIRRWLFFYLFKRKPLCAALLQHCSPFIGPVTMMLGLFHAGGMSIFHIYLGSQ